MSDPAIIAAFVAWLQTRYATITDLQLAWQVPNQKNKKADG